MKNNGLLSKQLAALTGMEIISKTNSSLIERIEDIYSAIASIKGTSVEELQNVIENNYTKIFTYNYE